MSYAQNLGLSTLWSGMGTTNPTLTAQVLDASTEKLACIFNMPYALTISHAGFWYGTYKGTPPTYKVSLQGVNSSGNPDGTIKGGGSPASATFTPPADATWDTQWKFITLSNSYSAARGELLSMVIEYYSGTISAANYSTMMGTSTAYGDNRLSFPNNQFYSGSAWAKYTNSPLFAIRDSTPSVVWGRLIEGHVDKSDSRSALKFNIPTTFCSTFKIRGAVIRLSPTAGNTFTFGLWGASLLQDVTVDTDTLNAITNYTVELFFDESSLSTLSAGTDYYIGIEQSGAVCTLACAEYNTNVNQQLAMPFGTNCCYSGWGGSSWTDNVNLVPIVILIFDDITPPSGGSGLLVHPGMMGGLRA